MRTIAGHRLRRAVGTTLRRRRQSAGLTQDCLAARAGITQPLVSRVERGLYPATLDLIQCLFDALELELHVEATAAHAELDREIAELASLSTTDRLVGSLAMEVLQSLRRWGPVPFVVEGALAAALQGAPIPVDDADVAILRTELDSFDRWLEWTAAMPWSEERQEFTYDRPDLRRCRTMRWQTGFAVARTRFVDEAPASIDVTFEQETYAVRPLAEVEVVDPHAAALMARWREVAAAGSVQLGSVKPGEAHHPVAAVSDELDEA
jgi:transcriptional regulator with XRE-family HTH domain